MRRLSVLVLLCGLLITAVAAGRTWLVIATTDPVLGEISIDASGHDLSPAITGALVLAGAAGLVAVLTRGWPRRVSALVLLLDGIWASWLSISVLVRPDTAAASAARSGGATPGGLGSAAAAISGMELSVWPWAFTLGAALVLLGGAGSLRADVSGARSAAAAAPAPASHDTTAPDLPAIERRRRENARAWDDLSEGKDLTP